MTKTVYQPEVLTDELALKYEALAAHIKAGKPFFYTGEMWLFSRGALTYNQEENYVSDGKTGYVFELQVMGTQNMKLFNRLFGRMLIPFHQLTLEDPHRKKEDHD